MLGLFSFVNELKHSQQQIFSRKVSMAQLWPRSTRSHVSRWIEKKSSSFVLKIQAMHEQWASTESRLMTFAFFSPSSLSLFHVRRSCLAGSDKDNNKEAHYYTETRVGRISRVDKRREKIFRAIFRLKWRQVECFFICFTEQTFLKSGKSFWREFARAKGRKRATFFSLRRRCRERDFPIASCTYHCRHIKHTKVSRYREQIKISGEF